jgi:hypothetical protein
MNLLSVLIIISGLSLTPNDRLNLFVDTLFQQYQINFETSQYELYKKDHNPKWRGNFEGGGVYVYEEYSIYFNNIVGFYKDIFIDQVSKDTYPDKIVFVCLSPDQKDHIYMIQCFGNTKMIKHENIDDEYYENNTSEYNTNKYKIIFISQRDKIMKIEIQKKKNQ